MKLNRSNWKNVKFSDVVLNINKIIKDPLANGIDKAIGLENIIPNNLKIQSVIDIKKNGTKFSKYFKSGQYLFGARRPYLRQMVRADIDGVCTANIMVFDVKDNNSLSNDYLSLIIQSDVFVNHATVTSVGSLFPNAKWEFLANFIFPLPPFEEQSIIAELFKSLETTIEQSELQKKNILRLKKALSSSLFSNEPKFGNLLNKENFTLTNFDSVAYCIEHHDKEKTEVSRFVGLENIEPENLVLTTWGNISEGTTFTKRFSKGDVLFGKRRAYLKKVAVADYDGICSGDILVLRAKENTILKELLPFYISSEEFINYAISTSAGSLSPRTKWKDLSKFEISIPDLNTQARILEVFQQIETILSQLKIQLQTLKNLKQKLLSEILG